jgi:hypothetical protein
MAWNNRTLSTGLPAFLISAIMLNGVNPALAGEPKAKASAPTEKKVESPNIPADVDYVAGQIYCIRDMDTKLMADVALPKAGKGLRSMAVPPFS